MNGPCRRDCNTQKTTRYKNWKKESNKGCTTICFITFTMTIARYENESDNLEENRKEKERQMILKVEVVINGSAERGQKKILRKKRKENR